MVIFHTWIYANEVTQGGSLDSCWMGAGHARKTNYVILDEALDLVVSADPEIEFNHVGNQ